MSDPVQEYLRGRAYAEKVVRGGLDYLTGKWEATVASVARGDPQYYYEYLNDSDTRRILAEALDAASPVERARFEGRVRQADDLILPHLVPTEHCIWGDEAARTRGYTRVRDWWYYHRPRGADESWPDEPSASAGPARD